jgi:hypothetical protein
LFTGKNKTENVLTDTVFLSPATATRFLKERKTMLDTDIMISFHSVNRQFHILLTKDYGATFLFFLSHLLKTVSILLHFYYVYQFCYTFEFLPMVLIFSGIPIFSVKNHFMFKKSDI